LGLVDNMLETTTTEKSFVDEENKLRDGFNDFSGKRSLLNKKFNKKYFVYKENGKETVKKNYEFKPLQLLETVMIGKRRVIFYCDFNRTVSFVITSENHKLSPEMVIDNIEKKPMLRTVSFLFFANLWFIGILRFKENRLFEEIGLSLGYNKSINYKINFLFPQKIRNRFSNRTNKLSLLLHSYWLRIPLKEIYQYYLKSSDINIPVFLKADSEGYSYYYSFKEKTKDRYNKKHYIYNTRSLRVADTDVEMYLRKSVTGQYVLVVSSILDKSISFKESLAYILTRLKRNKNVYDIYFEKFSQGASESGFELFKYAVTKNKKSIYILDSDNPLYKDLKKTYPENLFAKNSFKAFYYIFLARSFISSDLVSHVQRRLYDNDSLLKKKILKNKNKIFLQHGVSLATNLFERGYYNKKVPIAPDYIIVNSEFERNLFIDNSNYKEEELILSGLPNLDLYVHSRKIKKDEITFLLTWRPWDLTGKIEEGSYISRYMQFIELIKNEPFYSDKKINVILHPKAKLILKEQFEDIYNKNKHLFYEGDIKEALINSKVLISDYSSVTYMAFTGGTNIIFYWEDKEICEQEYGAANILQEDIAFGDVVYNFSDLHGILSKNFTSEQQPEYIEAFSNLVECTHGNNTKNTYNKIANILQQ
jgi:CDP-glycerol glycerophosphotransferase (TagB/SpsB family)